MQSQCTLRLRKEIDLALKFLNIPEQDAIRVAADAIQRQVGAILQAVNVPDHHAQITAQILSAASLRLRRVKV
jgi:hypothetical protein